MSSLLDRVRGAFNWYRGLTGWRSTLAAVGAIVVVVALLAGGAAAYQALSEESRAVEACEEDVRARLKAPSTAEFVDDPRVVEGADGYQVTGQVDAQNGFGAMIRNTYTCLAKKAPYGWYGSGIEFESAG